MLYNEKILSPLGEVNDTSTVSINYDVNVSIYDVNVSSMTSSVLVDVTTSRTLAPFDTAFYLNIFTLLTLAVILLGFFRAIHTFHILVRSAQKIHEMMLQAILRCPMLFFNTNPIGTNK